ncbi:hypothetical protein E2320_007372, partial [Naja naja]
MLFSHLSSVLQPTRTGGSATSSSTAGLSGSASASAGEMSSSEPSTPAQTPLAAPMVPVPALASPVAPPAILSPTKDAGPVCLGEAGAREAPEAHGEEERGAGGPAWTLLWGL